MKCPVANIFFISSVDLLWVSKKDSPFLRLIGTILNLLEQGFNRLLGTPCSMDVLNIDFQINRGDIALSAEYMVEHVLSGDVGKSNHVIIQNIQLHWFKNTDDLPFQSLLHGSVCVISLNVFLPDTTCCADLGGCAVRVGWSPYGGCWGYP
jgi:hypothetical protein